MIFRGICLCLAPCSQNPYILGPDNANVPKLLAIFAEALKEEALSGSQEVYQRVLAILRHIQVSYGDHVGQCSYPLLTQFTNISQCTRCVDQYTCSLVVACHYHMCVCTV